MDPDDKARDSADPAEDHAANESAASGSAAEERKPDGPQLGNSELGISKLGNSELGNSELGNSNPDDATSDGSVAGDESPKAAEEEEKSARWPPEQLQSPAEPGETDLQIDSQAEEEYETLEKSTAGYTNDSPGRQDDGAATPTESKDHSQQPKQDQTEADQSVWESPGEPQQQELQESRRHYLESLLKARRETEETASAAVQYADVLEAMGPSISSEVEQVHALLLERHANELQHEQHALQQHQQKIERFRITYDQLFVQLEQLAHQIQERLTPLDPEAEAFREVPDELQQELANYRKGIEIIHRMVSRTLSRKKQLASGEECQLEDTLEFSEAAPTKLVDLPQYAKHLHQNYLQLRDENYRRVRDCSDLADQHEDTTLSAMKLVLSAVDGIDGGLESEADIRERLQEMSGDDAAAAELVEQWCCAYRDLLEYADQFFNALDIEVKTASAGTPFDPETMEPQGTVSNPELSDEDVAAVMRRGYSYRGRLLRPILVDVVKNS